MHFAGQFNLNFILDAGEILQVFLRTWVPILLPLCPCSWYLQHYGLRSDFSALFNVRHDEGIGLARSNFRLKLQYKSAFSYLFKT